MSRSAPLATVSLALLLAIPAASQEPASPDGRLDVAFLVWDGMELIESMGPAHVFAFAPGMDEYAVGRTTDPIRSEFVTLVPEYSLEDCPPPDVIVIPGGSIWVPRGDPAYGEWLRRHVPGATLTVSVCNSAILLAELGLLDGKEATCGASNIDDIMLLGQDVRGYVNRRWVHSGNLITSSSYLGGLDAAIYAIRVLRGPEGEAQVLRWSNYGGDLSRYDALHAEPPLVPVSRRREVMRVLMSEGVPAAVEAYRAWVDSGEPAYSPPLDELDEAGMFQWMAWGNQRLGNHELSLAICELETELWPGSAKELAYLGEAQAKAGRLEEALETLLAALAIDGTDRRALVFLGDLLRQRGLPPSDATRRARDVLRSQATASTATLVPDGEPGTPLVVSGVVRDAAGEPVAGARIHVYQADADGHYTPEQPMAEPDARLFAFLRTGPDGTYRFETVRPGHYPGRADRTGIEWQVPAHVHFEVSSPGFRPRRFQMVFADDPRLASAHWQAWIDAGAHEIVEVRRDRDGAERCTCEVVLARG